MGGLITICVIGLFVVEFSVGVHNFIQKRKKRLSAPSDDGYSVLVTN